jgi:hypothetical protein
MLDLIFHAFYTGTIWLFLCEQNHVISGLLHHQLLLVFERLHFTVDTAYPHLLFLWKRIQLIVDPIYHHLVPHLAIFRKVPLYIEHTLGEHFIYYNGILAIIFGTVVVLVLFSRALVAVAKNIAMFKFKNVFDFFLKKKNTVGDDGDDDGSTSYMPDLVDRHILDIDDDYANDCVVFVDATDFLNERAFEIAAIVLQSAWRRKQAQTNLLYYLVRIIMVQSVARRYLSKEEVKIRQIKARFESDFLPTHGELWRVIASSKKDRPNKEERVATARRNVQPFVIRDKARVTAGKIESYEENKADCFSDLSEEDEFLGLMNELRAIEIIRTSPLFHGITGALAVAVAADNHRH